MTPHRTIYFGVALGLFGISPTFAQPEDEGLARDLVRSGQAIGVSSNEMARRASLQQSAANLEASLNGDPRFAGLQIIQSPTEFRVVAKFKGRLPTKAELTSDAELQAVLEIRPSGIAGRTA